MLLLYRIQNQSAPKQDSLYTEQAIVLMNLPKDTILNRSDGIDVTLEEFEKQLCSEPEKRLYQIANNSSILGSYTYEQLIQDPKLLDGVSYVWTAGYDNWLTPTDLYEIANLKTNTPTSTPPPFTSQPNKGMIPPPFPVFGKAPQFKVSKMKRKSLWELFIGCLKKYATFTGRASRTEYWSFVLFTTVLQIVLAWIPTGSLLGLKNLFWSNSIFRDLMSSITDISIAFPYFYDWTILSSSSINGIVGLAMFLPFLAVTSRRLHDTNRSAWWLLIFLVPVAGNIVILVFMLLAGDPNANKYGEIPNDYAEVTID